VRTLFGQRVDGLAREIPAAAAGLDKGQALAIGKQAGLGNRLATLRTENEKSEQMVWVDGNDRAHLVYVVSYFADSSQGGAPTRPFVIVDANTARCSSSGKASPTPTSAPAPAATPRPASTSGVRAASMASSTWSRAALPAR
jgi:hypothetical protein